MKNVLLLVLFGVSSVGALDVDRLYDYIATSEAIEHQTNLIEENIGFPEEKVFIEPVLIADALALRTIAGAVIHISENKAVTDADFIGVFNAINTWYNIHSRKAYDDYDTSVLDQFNEFIPTIPVLCRVNKSVKELAEMWKMEIPDHKKFANDVKPLLCKLHMQINFLSNYGVDGTSKLLKNISECIDYDIYFRIVFFKILSDEHHPFYRFLTSIVKI